MEENITNKMNEPFLINETSTSNYRCVSIRASYPFCQTKYVIFLSKFVTENEDIISEIRRTEVFMDAGVCTMIYMHRNKEIKK